MNTRTTTLIIAFTAVTVFLNPRFSGIAIPSFIPSLVFQIWEIAIVTSFFLLGLKNAVIISLLNTIILQVISPGKPFGQPLANFVAIISTLLGVYVAYKFMCHSTSHDIPIKKQKLILLSTSFGIISRVVIMLPFLYVMASVLNMINVLLFLPLFGLYDLTVALYTIPLGYFIARVVNNRFKLNDKI